MDDFTKIANQIKYQFPQFYREQGPTYIAFLEAYYEWLEQTNNITDQIRKLPNTDDIDRTADQFLEHFKYKYMNQLPIELIGNQRLFQKHILELYRAKGSVAGLKLLFRLLYNEDADVYVPSYDILKGSDGVWKQPQYIEVTDNPHLWEFEGKIIKGARSLATAVVESVEKITVDDRQVNAIFLSNIYGTFAVNESILYDGLSIREAPLIIGSPVGLTIKTSSANFDTGDLLYDPNISQKNLMGVVSEVYDSVGIIEFNIVDGGDLYSLDAEVSITPGTNTTGIGADFVVYSLSNVQTFEFNSDVIGDYATVALNATTYGFPANPAANSETLIRDSLHYELHDVGTIKSIATTNPGTGYDGDVTVAVRDPYTSTRGILFDDGWGGLNADITGTSLTGTGLIGNISVYDSGLAYNTDNQQMILFKQGDTSKQAVANIILGAVGYSAGYFDDTKGFVSEDKYLYDGQYYQDYSYVIRSARTLDYYVNILKNTVHSAGNAVFSIAVLASMFEGIVDNKSSITQISDDGSFSPLTRIGSFARNSIATYDDQRLVTAQINQPRYPTINNQSRGLLFEPAKNNILLWSQEFDNAYWIKPNSSIIADAAVAPDGTMTMDKLVDSTSNSAHGCVRSVSYLSGETYTLSVYAKAGEYSKLRINAPFDSGVGLANFDLVAKTATVVNGSGAVARIEDVGDGLFRCSLTITATNTNTQNVGFYLINNAGDISFAGTGSSGLYIWGAQLESGLAPTSYIKTESINGSRAGDSLTIPTNQFDYNTGEGTILVDFWTPSVISTAYAGILAGLRSLADINATRCSVGISTTRILSITSYDQGVLLSYLGFGTLLPNTRYRVAYSFQDQKYSGSLNGGAVVVQSGPTRTVPVFDTLEIGHLNNNNQFGGTLVDCKYWPIAMSDSQLQQISSLS